ncbi:MAG: CPBP family intramembrane metalloprotease domain-containing protein, partial [Prevotellaceae bacterium]|nr:CPBP family intramembrane metalloprotease domain-containing protein [Prevotellaceae bacterium]
MNKVKVNSIIGGYRHTALFYSLSVLIPWLFWFGAEYVSHITPYQGKYLNIASVMAFAGLLAPAAVAYALISKNAELRKDVAGRFFNFREMKLRHILLACLIMPASILLAQAVS